MSSSPVYVIGHSKFLICLEPRPSVVHAIMGLPALVPFAFLPTATGT